MIKADQPVPAACLAKRAICSDKKALCRRHRAFCYVRLFVHIEVQEPRLTEGEVEALMGVVNQHAVHLDALGKIFTG